MTTAIGNYKETQVANTSTILPIFSVLSNSSAIGQSTDLSSDVVYKEAKAFRFTAAVATDFYTPQFTINSNQTIFQAKSLELQAFHYKKTSVNSYERSQNLHSVVANTQYCYATNERFVAAPVQIHQASKQIFYGDRIKIQAGKPDLQKVAPGELGATYGRFDVGAINDVTLTSKDKGVLFQGKEHITMLSDNDLLINAEGRTAFTSKTGMAIKSDSEVALHSGGNLSVSSAYSLVINGGTSVNISGQFVSIGGAVGSIGSISLDVLALGSQIAMGALSLASGGGVGGLIGSIAGPLGIGNFLSVPGLLNTFSTTLFSQLPDQLAGVVTTSLNSLIAGNIAKTIDGFTTENFLQIVGSVLPANLTEEAAKYSGIINAVIPSIGNLSSVFNKYSGDGFYFDDYPRIEDVPPLSTAPSTNPFSSVVIDGVNYYITPNGE
jgi:hypothetical protein